MRATCLVHLIVLMASFISSSKVVRNWNWQLSSVDVMVCKAYNFTSTQQPYLRLMTWSWTHTVHTVITVLHRCAANLSTRGTHQQAIFLFSFWHFEARTGKIYRYMIALRLPTVRIFPGCPDFIFPVRNKMNTHSGRRKSPVILQLAELLIYLTIILCKIQHLNSGPLLSVF
jgi:hypothetical protein